MGHLLDGLDEPLGETAARPADIRSAGRFTPDDVLAGSGPAFG